jgi:molecular chaperone GrpE (heat shock protein)
MLAEIAIANAAFGVIKNAISNGQELHSVATQVTSYFDSKSTIAKKAKNGGNKSDMEAFMALESIKEQETELREIMIYAGRANMYDDWLQFQADCKRARAQEEKDKQYASAKHKQHIIEFFTIICTALVAIPVLGSAVYLILTILGR